MLQPIFFSFYIPITVNIHTYHVYRLCAWEHVHAPRNECVNAHTPSYIKTDFCETCDTDGCNGATHYGPYAILIAIPIFIAKHFII